MPWQNNNGGGRGPWGQGPKGPQGPQPPNLEEIFKRGQDRMKGFFPGGWGGKRGVLIAVVVLVVVWLFSGFYRVESDEQGVVLRFGEWAETTQPGLNYHLPYPIETVETPKVTRINRADVGFRAPSGEFGVSSNRDIPEESLMLTGDENIIDIDFTVFWEIRDAGRYLFNIEDPVGGVKDVAESAMREVIGKTDLQFALTEGRADVEQETLKLVQRTLDEYGAGILVREVKLQDVNPPSAVIDAFRDVQAARADQERAVNEAQAYSNDIIPRARGQAAQIVQDAEAYKEQVVADAEGQASRFSSILTQYQTAEDVTRKRLYLETIESVLQGMDKVIIDEEAGSGVVPYMALPELRKSVQQQQSN